jgi:DNA polymerase III alpha subunit (gram-positive type)
MIKDAPKMGDILPDFLKFIGGSCLCAYNMPFDLGFLNSELSLAGLPALEDFAMVDILTMSRKLFPGLERHALWFVAKALGIESKQEHRAFSDVELTWELFQRMKSSLQEKGVNEFENFLTLFGASQKLLTGITRQKIAKIEEAIELGLKIKIKYFSRSTAQFSERKVLPKEISFEAATPYLIGFCSLRNEERTFRVDNILDLEII